MTDRSHLLHLIAARIADAPGGAIRVVGIDGIDGAGKTVFAGELAPLVAARGRPVLRAGIDGFHYPRARRYRRGRNDSVGYFEDSFDLAALRRHLLDRFREQTAATVQLRRFDHRRDAPAIVEAHATPDTVLIFDGVFLHRPELRDAWDFSIFLDVPFAISVARMAARDGTPPDPDHPDNRRYVEGQRLYLHRCRPEAHATFAIDHTDPDRPVLVTDRSARADRG